MDTMFSKEDLDKIISHTKIVDRDPVGCLDIDRTSIAISDISTVNPHGETIESLGFSAGSVRDDIVGLTFLGKAKASGRGENNYASRFFSWIARDRERISRVRGITVGNGSASVKSASVVAGWFLESGPTESGPTGNSTPDSGESDSGDSGDSGDSRDSGDSGEDSGEDSEDSGEDSGDSGEDSGDSSQPENNANDYCVDIGQNNTEIPDILEDCIENSIGVQSPDYTIKHTLESGIRYDLKKISDMIGRRLSSARSLGKKVERCDDYGFKSGRTIGGRIHNARPWEIAQLKNRNHAMRTLSMLRIATNQADSYEQHDLVKCGHGPIIGIFDFSESMCGDPMDACKSLILSLLVECKRKYRDMSITMFGSKSETMICPAGRLNSMDIACILSHGHMGGTDIGMAFDDAIGVYDRGKWGSNRPDIIIVTDGQISDDDARAISKWKCRRKDRDPRIHAITIGKQYYNHVDMFADSIVNVESLSSEDVGIDRVVACV
jgi:uncharacterized protein with von Willebrand factor type A (vWA) domain